MAHTIQFWIFTKFIFEYFSWLFIIQLYDTLESNQCSNKFIWTFVLNVVLTKRYDAFKFENTPDRRPRAEQQQNTMQFVVWRAILTTLLTQLGMLRFETVQTLKLHYWFKKLFYVLSTIRHCFLETNLQNIEYNWLIINNFNFTITFYIHGGY